MQLIQRSGLLKGSIRRPVDPHFLVLSGVIDPGLPLAPVPAAGEPWQQEYRMFFNTGINSQSTLMGVLKMHSAGGVDPAHLEQVRGTQWILTGGVMRDYEFHGKAVVERVDFRMRYKAGALVGWDTRQCMIDYSAGGKAGIIRPTVLERSCAMADDRVFTTVNGKTQHFTLKAGVPLYSDWDMLFRCLSFPFTAETKFPCQLVEELGVLRPDCTVYYAGQSQSPLVGALHAFVLQGRGIIPVDYWLNGDHRLIAALSGSFAEGYIPAELVAKPLVAPLKDALVTDFSL